MKKKANAREGISGSGDFAHGRRKGKVFGGAPDWEAKLMLADDKVRARPRTPPAPLEDYEVELGRMIDTGEVETTELIDGKMVKSNWPDDWPD